MLSNIRLDPTRLLHITIIILQVFSVAQVVWWFVDQTSYAEVGKTQMLTLYNYDAAAAQRLVALGVSPAEVTSLFPHISVTQGEAAVATEALAALDQQQAAHTNQYAWESGFFLLVLAACIAVLWRGLNREAEIRRKQDNFLAMVSHQFKTPLASLQLSLETMLRRPVSPDRFQQLSHRMLDDLRRMENMVSKILDTARLDRGRVPLNKERIVVADAVRHVAGSLEETARRDHVNIVVEVPGDLEVIADPMAMDGVLRNLIENALSAMVPTRGGTLTITGRRIDGTVELAITDTGVGFEPEQGRQLFDKFYRIDNHGGRDSTGTGLGLYIVQRFMQFEHGAARAHSAGPGKGATFTVIWPEPAEQRS